VQDQQVVHANIKKRLLGEIPIDKIAESQTNPRTTFGNLDELEASIKRTGVLVPVLVRERSDGFYLISGARRVRAAANAGLEAVPAIALECSDEEVLEIQLVENCQREDVHPMEEAEGIERLLQLEHKRGAADPLGAVALRLGKPRAHIHRRMRLLRLPTPARKAYLGGEISTEHALVIARLQDAEARERAWKLWKDRPEWQDGMTAAQFADRVEQYILLELKSAGFDTSDTTLVPSAGACGPCPKRTGNAQDLFGGVSGDEANLCTDPACFKLKLDAAWARKVEKAKESGRTVLEAKEAKKIFAHGDYVASDSGFIGPTDGRYDSKKGTSVPYSKLLKGQKVEKVIVRAPSGKAVELYRKADVEAALRSRKAKDPKAQKEREAELKAEKAEKARREREKLEAKVLEGLIPAIVSLAEKLKPAELYSVLTSLLLSGDGATSFEELADRRGVTLKQIGEERDPKVLQGILLEAAIPAGYLGDERVDALKALTKYFKIDLAAQVKRAETAPSSPASAKKGGKK
jgi:ParB/RepB/Spo0J family partition protein